MTLFSKPLYIAMFVLVCTCSLFFLRLQTLQERNTRLQQSYAQEHATSGQRQYVIDRLQQQITHLSEQQRQSAEAQAELERLTQNRLATLRKLEDENGQLREWANHHLPVELGRLRDRDALSSASAYRQRLRDT